MEKSQTGKQTLVEEGTELKGTLKSTCQVVVNGRIEGQIEAPALTVTATGAVLGTVRAQKLRSDGTLAGDIDAEDVYLSGTVKSNTLIRAKKLEVKLAPERGKLEVTFGECMVEVGEDPAQATEQKSETAIVAATPATSVLAASALGGDREPRWSEPSGPSDATASAVDAMGSKDDRKNNKKSNERRDSQAPPAS
jgi:cytoskeletal protein CcmA (bactofilin family)